MPEPIRSVISDTSPLQYLYQVRQFDLLQQLYGQVFLAQAVEDELAVGRKNGVYLPNSIDFDWLQVHIVSPVPSVNFPLNLGSGETETIQLALNNPGSLTLLDDGPARRFARSLGLSVTGTLGVLLRARQSGLLPAIAPVLDLLETRRFRLASATRQEVLRLAGELL